MNRTEKPNGGPLMAANMTRAELAAEAKRASLIYCRALLDCSDRATEKNVQVAEHAAKSLHEAIDQLAAHQAEPPQGWKLVPEESTDDMKHAANERYRTYRLATAGDLYRAMLAAAPSIPSNGGAGEAL